MVSFFFFAVFNGLHIVVHVSKDLILPTPLDHTILRQSTAMVYHYRVYTDIMKPNLSGTGF